MTLLILTGFMGTGKTTVGRRVAQNLGWEFIDTDTEIIARMGKSIRHIFHEDGEGTFRHWEATLCAELSTRTRLVIATGGGTLLDAHTRALLLQAGQVICLTCEIAEIFRRIEASNSGIQYSRPLLEGADRNLKLRQLLQERAAVYAALPWHIETTHCSVDEVVEQVLNIIQSTTLPVNSPDGRYEIYIGPGLLSQIGGLLRTTDILSGSRVAVVVNPTVASLYYEEVAESLRAAQLAPFPCLISDGEFHKTLATVAAVYEQLLANGMDRKDVLLALGGGVTSDVAGFVAATFMRGVHLAQIPTTLLAMVDASVGGKNGVNLAEVKNIIGTFKQPRLVLIDPYVLATLPQMEIRAGLAELIKHSLIGAPDLFCELENAAPLKMSQLEINNSWITRALQVKITLIEEDPFDQGARAALNLGHTLGHALESLSHAGLRHGEAVSIGMVAAARLGAALGLGAPTLAARLEHLLTQWGLPTHCPPFNVTTILQMIAHDKKKLGSTVAWIIPGEVGKVLVGQTVPTPIIRGVLRSMGAREDE